MFKQKTVWFKTVLLETERVRGVCEQQSFAESSSCLDQMAHQHFNETFLYLQHNFACFSEQPASIDTLSTLALDNSIF